MPRQCGPRGAAQHGATTEGQDALVLGQGRGDGLLLQRAEVLLAVVDEDLLDRGAVSSLDVTVGVADVDAPATGQLVGDRRLAGTGRADQHHERPSSGHANLRFDR